MTIEGWFKPRGYAHFDVAVDKDWATAVNSAFVIQHGWSPLLHFVKKTKRYKVIEQKTRVKPRSIMFASHRDAAILSKYSAELVRLLDNWYVEVGLEHTAIAYRSLGKSNYHFAKEVQDYVRSHDPVSILCLDVTGFFDNINHLLLKHRLRWILGGLELSRDWYGIFRFVTRYRYVDRDELKAHPLFGPRLTHAGAHSPIATVRQLKAAQVHLTQNDKSFGIPQGTPISASLSNLYLTDFDLAVKAEADLHGALYQRYSDDILIACEPQHAATLEAFVLKALSTEGLQVQSSKTDRRLLAGLGRESFQYLGYQLGFADAEVRPGSLSRQWRTVRRALRKAERQGLQRIAPGQADRIYTRKLTRKLTYVGPRNFLSYVKRSASELESAAMLRQAKKLARFSRMGIARIKKHRPRP